MKKMIIMVLVTGIVVLIAASLYAGGATKPPEVITLDSLTDKYESVMFTHERHAMIAGNCGTCHHEHGDSGKLPCKSCHALDVNVFKNSVTHNFTACKSCHAAYAPENPKMPGLKVAYHKTCLQCHRDMGNVGKDPKGCAELCHAKRDVTLSKKLN